MFILKTEIRKCCTHYQQIFAIEHFMLGMQKSFFKYENYHRYYGPSSIVLDGEIKELLFQKNGKPNINKKNEPVYVRADDIFIGSSAFYYLDDSNSLSTTHKPLEYHKAEALITNLMKKYYDYYHIK